ncbi:hypothetical protein IQ22_01047 [Pseudomonas duriflava]|uniref:Uncharacterized protein n=1 Tax=Pseudomonas duriflava TaxID=459528 RepID=A0A562QKM2_9PSED|nr:hypothetical protein [Pseudomonas duriflava]TWI56596.1 hypothetical protein IQ22_01047 [Pseudomonas duriflava]
MRYFLSIWLGIGGCFVFMDSGKPYAALLCLSISWGIALFLQPHRKGLLLTPKEYVTTKSHTQPEDRSVNDSSS